MAEFIFDLQRFAWSQVSEGSWLYTSGSSSFYLNGDYDADEDDSGASVPQNVSVSGTNVTIEPDWTSSISIVGGNWNFVDDYDSFAASLASGDQAGVDEDSVWSVSGSGYVYYNYIYCDSDVTVNDLEGAPSGRMTLSTSAGSNGFTNVSVNVNGAETSDYTTFSVYSIPCKISSSSGDNFSLIPNILRVEFDSSGPTFFANDTDETEITYRTLAGFFANYDSSTRVLTLVDGASDFDDSTTLDIEVDGISAGVHVVGDKFTAFCANETSISIATSDDFSYTISDGSWIWDPSTDSLYFDTNMTMTGVSGVSGSTSLTVGDDQISISGATLTNAAIDDITITGTDNNPSNGYVINIVDGGQSYSFVEDTSTSASTIASINYDSNGAFTFLDTNGSVVDYSSASVDFTTLDGALVLGESSPLEITITSARDRLAIFDVSIAAGNLVGLLNSGDVFADDHIATDASPTNAWEVEGSSVTLGANDAVIGGISVDSTTSIVKSGDLISIQNATLDGGSVNGSAITGTDDDPSDGYRITLNGSSASFVESPSEYGALASIVYNGSYTFADADGNTMPYSSIESLIAAEDGGFITLLSSAPSNITISSSVDGVSIFNESNLAARLNSGDSYSNGAILTDSDPINAWTIVDNNLIINGVTIGGINVDTSSAVVMSGDVIAIENATITNGSINGAAINGTDDDPSDGYLITLASDGSASFLGAIVELASIGYNGSFTFYDSEGETVSYEDASLYLSTAPGGSITLNSSAPANLSIASSVDGLNIFEESILSARINAADVYVDGAIQTDASPTNAWTILDNTLTIDGVTISGITVDTSSSIVKDGDLITIQNATIENGSVDGTAIGGTDDNPSDGYRLSLGADGWTFLESTLNPWTSINGGFIYVNDYLEFTLQGSGLVDSDQNGRPDNISVSISTIEGAGTFAIVNGLSGDVSLNGTSLGILGDSLYSAGILFDGYTYIADAFSNISGGSTIYADGAYIGTDFSGEFVFGDGVYTLNDAAITVNNNNAGLNLTLDYGTINAVSNLRSGGLLNGFDGATVTMQGSATVNGISYTTDDPNIIVVNGNTISGLDADALLMVSPSGTYVVNSTPIQTYGSSAIYGINETLAGIGTQAELRARSLFNVPEDAEFISGDRVHATVVANGTNTIGGRAFNGDKIIELSSAVFTVHADFTESSGQKFVVIDGDRFHEVTFYKHSQNGAVIEADVDSEKIINAGDSGDTIFNYSTKSDVTINGGEGADSIQASGGEFEVLNLSKGGKDLIYAPDGASVQGYDASTGAAFLTPISKANLVSAIENENITFEGNSFNVNGGGAVKIDTEDDETAVNLIDVDGNSTRVRFANLADTSLGADDINVDQLLYGRLEDLTIQGGSGSDTILVGERNIVDGGAGNDVIKLLDAPSASEDGETETVGGSKVKVGSGNDSVENFKTGWNTDTSDQIVINGRDSAEYSIYHNDLNVSTGDGDTLLVREIKAEGTTRLLVDNSIDENPTKLAFVDGGTTFEATSGSDYADRYIVDGDAIGLNLSNVTDNVSMNLNDSDHQNINNVTLGSGQNLVVGSSENETFVAGVSNSTIRSGDGNDSLIANSSDGKIGGTTFVYSAGLDTISHFETFDPNNSLTADEIVFDARIITVETFGNDVVLEAGSVDQLTILDAANSKIKVNGGVFEAGYRLNYGAEVNGYFGAGNSTVMVGSEGGNVWLNGAIGTYYDKIRVINASGALADSTLVGNSDNNYIIGGSGNNSLWGAGGGDDTLVGGGGYNEYYYLHGDGADVINSSNDDDLIKLLNIGWDQIDRLSQRVTGDSIELRFNDGGSLKVNTSSDVRFELSNGSRWSIDRSNGSWYSRS